MNNQTYPKYLYTHGMYFEGAKEIISQENTFSYCNYAKYGGVFRLVNTLLFTDYKSTFNTNSANYGGVLSLDNSSAYIN